VTDSARTSDTAIAPFVKNFVNATVSDYGSLGVTLPDLSFTAQDANEYGDSVYIADPLTTGTTPGRAYEPKQSAIAIDSTGRCVDTRIVSGGAIGYRMLDAQPGTDAKVSAWVNQLKALASAGKVPVEVADTAGDIYSPSSVPDRSPRSRRAHCSTVQHGAADLAGRGRRVLRGGRRPAGSHFVRDR
jgi:hypothetical protein